MDFLSNLIYPLKWGAAWLLVRWHDLFTGFGLPAESGITWIMAILGVVVVVRALVLPLSLKQIISSRSMHGAQPEMQRIQKKYKGKRDMASQQAMRAEMQEVYREHGNPMASCLPILVQMPIFFAMFAVFNQMDNIARGVADSLGPLTAPVAEQFEQSEIFGAQLSETFLRSEALEVKALALVLVIAMSLSQWYSMRQLMTLNTPKSAFDNPMMQSQKMLMYVFPVVFGVTGLAFPIGLLIYWFVSNVWTTIQQLVLMYYLPSPGSPAEEFANARRAKAGKPPIKYKSKREREQEREAKRRTKRGLPPEEQSTGVADGADSAASTTETAEGTAEAPELQAGNKQRAQPKRKKKRRR